MTKQIAIQIANRLATKLANDLTTLLDGFKAECERIVAQIPEATTPVEQAQDTKE